MSDTTNTTGLRDRLLRNAAIFHPASDLSKMCVAAAESIQKLQAFKDYTHARLDAMGVPVDPESPHKAAGCRIGGRMDYVADSIAALHTVAAALGVSCQPRPILDEIARLAARQAAPPAAAPSGVSDAVVERAITAAMAEARREGVGMCSPKWDTSFPTRRMWRGALEAAQPQPGRVEGMAWMQIVATEYGTGMVFSQGAEMLEIGRYYLLPESPTAGGQEADHG